MKTFGANAGAFMVSQHGALWRVARDGALYADFLTQGNAERGAPNGAEWSAITELQTGSEAAQHEQASS